MIIFSKKPKYKCQTFFKRIAYLIGRHDIYEMCTLQSLPQD